MAPPPGRGDEQDPGAEPILAGLRVLDLTDEFGVAGPRLLAALGAEVLRPELPGGDDLRVRRPKLESGEGGGTSLAHLVHNAGKQSIVVDWRTEEGKRELHELMAGSDITICSPGRTIMRRLGLDPATFAAEHPETALVLLDPFPAGSPFRDDSCEDLVLSATSGFAWLCGDAAGTPEHPKGQMASAYGAIAASLAGLLGLTARHLHGRAGWYQLSGQEAVAFSTSQTGDVNELTWLGHLPGRLSWSENPHGGLYRCADGRWVNFVTIGGRSDQLILWLQEEHIGDGFGAVEWLDYEHFYAHLDEVSDAVADLCSRHRAADMVSLGQGRMLMVLPLLTAEELLVDPQLVAREVFVPVTDSPLPLRLPRAPIVFGRGRLPKPSAAPAIDQHDADGVRQWKASASARAGRPARPATAAGSQPLPLSGLRVADFSWMLAAPMATRILADLGADVVRIESYLRRDLAREVGTQPPGWNTLDTISLQFFAGTNKRSIALNLSHPTGVDIARRIIATSDIVLDNYRPGTMAKWGFDPDALVAERPDLIVVTMPAVGSTGPHSHFGGIGPGVAAYAGVNLITGFPQNPPRGLGPLLADFFAPLFTVQGVLAAVHHRAVTGQGQYIDCSMLEASLWLLDTSVAEYQLLGRNPERIGNRNPRMAPHGIFPSAGDDEWIAIAIRTDAEWRAFCRIAPVTANNAIKYARAETRQGAEDDVERLVAEATRRRPRWELAAELQAVGVAAAPVEHVGDHLSNDPGMAARFSEGHHPFGFDFHAQAQFIRPEGRVVPSRRAPMLGEHSDEILRELGFDDDQITELIAGGAIR